MSIKKICLVLLFLLLINVVFADIYLDKKIAVNKQINLPVNNKVYASATQESVRRNLAAIDLPPTASISVSPKQPKEGEAIKIKITAKDDKGLDKIELHTDKWKTHNCNGATSCSHEWSLTLSEGSYTYFYRVKDEYGHAFSDSIDFDVSAPDDSDKDNVPDYKDKCVGESLRNLPANTQCTEYSFNSNTGCHVVNYKPINYIVFRKNCDGLDTACRNYYDAADYCDGKGNIVYGICNNYINNNGTSVCNANYGIDYECKDGNSAGNDIFKQTVVQFCGVNNGQCNGKLSNLGNYVLQDDCTLDEQCADNQSICTKIPHAPVIEDVSAYPNPAEVGDRVYFSVDVTDEDKDIANVTVEFLGNTYSLPYYEDNEYELDIDISGIVAGNYSITAFAEDLNGLKAVPLTDYFLILPVGTLDREDPVIHNVYVNPETATKGQNVTITANITDNVGIDEVWVEIQNINGNRDIEADMYFDVVSGLYTISFNTSNASIGIHEFDIEIKDTSRNYNDYDGYVTVVECIDADSDSVCDNNDACVGESQQNLPSNTECSSYSFNDYTGCHAAKYNTTGTIASEVNCDYLDTACRDYKKAYNTCDGNGSIIAGSCNYYTNDAGTTICNNNYGIDYECKDGTSAGKDVFNQDIVQYCGVNTGQCNGEIDFSENYALQDDCNSNEYCVDGITECQRIMEIEAKLCKDNLFLNKTISECETSIDDADLPDMLARETYTDNNGNTHNSVEYDQTIYFSSKTPNVGFTTVGSGTGRLMFHQDSDDAPYADVYLFIDDSSTDALYRYDLIFTTAIDYDNTSSTTAKKDIVGTELKIQGRTYTIINANVDIVDNIVNAYKEIWLFEGEKKWMKEGEKIMKNINGISHKIKLANAYDNESRCMLQVDGILTVVDIYTTETVNGITIGVNDILPDYCELVIDTTKITLRHNAKIKINDVDLDGSKTNITHTQSGKWDGFRVLYAPSNGEVYLGVGDEWTDTVFNSWSFDFANVEREDIENINLDVDANGKTGRLRFTNESGALIELPFFADDIPGNSSTEPVRWNTIPTWIGSVVNNTLKIKTKNKGYVVILGYNGSETNPLFKGVSFFERNDGEIYSYLNSADDFMVTVVYDDLIDKTIELSYNGLGRTRGYGFVVQSNYNDDETQYMTLKGTLIKFDDQDKKYLHIEHPYNTMYAEIYVKHPVIPAIEKTIKECHDSEKGINYYIQGTVDLSNGQTFSDQCEGGNNLIEYSCSENNLTFTNYYCSNGCLNGGCMGATDNCVDGYLWNVDYTDYGIDKIYKLTTNGTIIKSFNSPADWPVDLTFDGTYLWLSDARTNKVYKLTTDGTIVDNFSPPHGEGGTGGLAWAGTYLWYSNYYDDIIYKLTTDGTVISSFSSQAFNPQFLTWDGTYLWVVESIDRDVNKIYKLTSNGVVVDIIYGPETETEGLVWDGKYLWNADSDTDKIYKLTTNGTVVAGFNAPGDIPHGLAWEACTT